jgi:hypothetical protein
MNNADARSLLSGLRGRDGVAKLARALGFNGSLQPVAAMGEVSGVRTTLAGGRSTITLYVMYLRRTADPPLVQAAARALRRRDAVLHHLLLLVEPNSRRIILALSAPGGPPRCLTLDPAKSRECDVDALAEVLDAGRSGDTAAAVHMGRALDRSRTGVRFFRDVTAIRDTLARNWTGMPLEARQDRKALALLLLSRLIFLYFLQRRGVLNADSDFLPALLRRWLRRDRAVSFYRCQLQTLFFGALNRRPAVRTARARAIGDLPYLNGGLFEQQAVEFRWKHHDVRDDVMIRVFRDLLERYRFTSRDAALPEDGAADSGGIDPEMLGRIFEGLMPGEKRGRTGTFYTPAVFVDHVISRALTHHISARSGIEGGRVSSFLRQEPATSLSESERSRMATICAGLRVLDPACGSGAFLVAMLGRVAAIRLLLDPKATVTDVRRSVLAHTLHGVDVLEDAALLCSLRLWLALIPAQQAGDPVAPLPNLDRRIRQGDSLVDPLDITSGINGRPIDSTAPANLRMLITELQPTAQRYLQAEPDEKPQLRRTLARIERQLAAAWLNTVQSRLDWDCRELAARARDSDLFGAPTSQAQLAQRALPTAEMRRAEIAAFVGDLHGGAHLPFFSFRVHFAEAGQGFDLIVGNPPWIRSHRWPAAVRDVVRSKYRVCRNSGWPRAAQLTGFPAAAGSQVDLSLLFLEQSCRLLHERGTLALLMPAKAIRSLYAGGGRELLLEETRLVELDDHSLNHRAVFDADAYTAVFIAHRRGPEVSQYCGTVSIAMHRSDGDILRFAARQEDLPLVQGDIRAPWLLAPPAVTALLRTMQRSAPCLGELLPVRRGVITGANDVLILKDVEPRLGDLAKIRAEGYYRASHGGRSAFSAWVEGSSVRPLLRGSDVAAWRSTICRHVLWAPINDEPGALPGLRMQRYLHRHRNRLGNGDAGNGALQRLNLHTLGHKVVWSDLASELRAAAVPATMRSIMGMEVPVVPLNTVYFIGTRSADESLLLAAYMNSLPMRAFARVIAERAKDAHFRFFAWTIAALPLPADWLHNDQAPTLTELSRSAHTRGGCTRTEQERMDALVACSLGLDLRHLGPLRAFDAWLGGRGTAEACR